MKNIIVEAIGWLSTISFLISIVVPNRKHLHYLGVFASVTTGFYAYKHGATAIWVKWIFAFFFHVWMILKLSNFLTIKNKKSRETQPIYSSGQHPISPPL